ncbi:hypothetical protein I4U23_001438 [Adineta vaga]|nr:hypothetical protein I4U23_001438 [Adineta vaga]
MSHQYRQDLDIYCGNQLWLTIYTFVIAAVLPSILNLILNTLIFLHVRSSTRRVHPQMLSTTTSGAINPQIVINRRDIALLRQMIFMFSMFVGGWTPAFIISIFYEAMDMDFKFVQICLIFSQICVLGIVINLFMYNRELRQYLSDKIRNCFRR